MSDSVWDILFSPYADIYLPLWFESRGPTTATVNQPAHDQRDAFYTHKSAHEEEENADVELEMEEAKSKDDGIKIVVKASPYPPVGISFLDLDVQSDSGSDHVSGSSSEGTGETSLEIDPYLESPKTVSEMSPEFQGEHSKRYVDLADRLALLAEDFQLSSSQVHLMGDDLNKLLADHIRPPSPEVTLTPLSDGKGLEDKLFNAKQPVKRFLGFFRM